MLISIYLRVVIVTVTLFFFVATCGVFPNEAEARRVESWTHTSVHHSGSRHRYDRRDYHNNRNVNVNIHSNRRYYDDRHHHNDVGSFVAGAVTGLVVGSIVTAASMPPSCSSVIINNVAYKQCGNTWYQPRYYGSQVNYIVVNPPR